MWGSKWMNYLQAVREEQALMHRKFVKGWAFHRCGCRRRWRHGLHSHYNPKSSFPSSLQNKKYQLGFHFLILSLKNDQPLSLLKLKFEGLNLVLTWGFPNSLNKSKRNADWASFNSRLKTCKIRIKKGNQMLTWTQWNNLSPLCSYKARRFQRWNMNVALAQIRGR